MDDAMAPPSKRRKLLDPAQDVAQLPEPATKSSIPPFSHGVEHIAATTPTQSLYARPSPHHVEEVHLEIHTRSVPSAEEPLRVLRRQGTAALTDIITTNSDAEVVVAVTAMVDALGSTTALTTAAVTVDVPDLPSLLATSTTTAVVSEGSAEPTASFAQESSSDPTSSSAQATSADPNSSSAQETSADPTSSTAQESSAEPTSPSGSSQSEPASSSENSRSSDASSSTNPPSSSTSTQTTSLPAYVVSPASDNGTDTDTQNESQPESSKESETGSSVAPSSTAGSAPASYSAPSSYGASSSQDTATLDSFTSSNSTVAASTSASSQSQTSQTVFTPTGSGFSAQTGSASSRNSLNQTISGKLATNRLLAQIKLTDFGTASTSTSGSVILVSDFTVNYASSTSGTNSKATDSSSSIDLNLLYLLTQSNGDVATLTRSDEPFTTSISGASEIVVPPSSSVSSDSRISAPSVSEYVTTISNDQTTARSTVFSTASASPTQSSSDDSNGVGFAGIAGDGATATSNGVSTTSAPADTNDGDDEPAPAGTIAGGVVGGAAGLALVALIILLFLRRYKKRAQLGHLALPANAAGPAAGGSSVSGSGGRGMAERAGLMPLVGAVPALFRHQNRSQNSGSETGER